MTDKEIDNRFMAMEMKLAFMEDFVNQIQEVAVEQAKTIDKLKGEIKLMSNKIREMSDSLEGEIPNRKPPHY
ncbi:MAG: SlyX family protein [Treponema sp.]|nr:SlyX family protein [Spirochaetia bacterium]MDY2825638.1 SlyX family protein [Treponema sp.]MDY4767453.1 SlyX family protein [Treponema sp.]